MLECWIRVCSFLMNEICGSLDTESFCSLLGEEEGYKNPKGTKYVCEGRIFLADG